MKGVPIFFITSAILIATAVGAFETISDDDLVERIKTTEFFVALFCKPILFDLNVISCSNTLKFLINIRRIFSICASLYHVSFQ